MDVFRRTSIAVALFMLLVAGRTNAATFNVNSTVDAPDANPGDGLCVSTNTRCTLRAAVMEGNALAGTDTIELPAGTFVLTRSGSGEANAATGDLDLNSSFNISGVNAASTIIDAAALGDRVFEISSGPILMVRMTIRNGTAPLGGGIAITGSADVNLNGLTLSGNAADFGGGIGVSLAATSLIIGSSSLINNTAAQTGGGIYARGFLMNETDVLNNSVGPGGTCGGGIAGTGGGQIVINGGTISGNSAPAGGGLCNTGVLPVTISGSYIAENEATANMQGGGALLNGANGEVSIFQTTFAMNTSAGPGGAIANNAGEITLETSTFSGNASATRGGAVDSLAGSVLAHFVTFANNSAPTGATIFAPPPVLTQLVNSILAAPPGVQNCSAIETLSAGTVATDGSCELTGLGDQPNTDPLLGPLRDNGGSTPTHALLPGSPAIDAAVGSCFPIDQRGMPRPQGAGCDSGAFELATNDLALTKTASPTPAISGQALTYTLRVTNAGAAGATNVTVTDVLPASVTFVSANTATGNCSQAAGTVTCNLGALNSGGVVDVTIIVVPNAAGLISNTATVTAAEVDAFPASNQSTLATPVVAAPAPAGTDVPSLSMFSLALLGACLALASLFVLRH